MKRIVIYSADPWNSAISHLRIRQPAHYLGWDLYPGKSNAGIDLKAIDNADYIIIQRDFPRFPQCAEIIKIAKKKSIPVIYDIDDCIFNTPRQNKQFEAYRYYFSAILNTIISADRVIVSTNYLYKQLITFNRNLYIFPNYLPDNLWILKPPLISNSSSVIIGYMGSNTHREDLDLISPVLDKILAQNKNIEIKIWGCEPPASLKSYPEVQHYHVDFEDYIQFIHYFQGLTCDFFIAPLLDTPFNRGKSGIKFLEYSTMGIPGIYMNIDPYSTFVIDGENGYIASNHKEWQERIQVLISDENTRLRLAVNAQKTAQQNLLSNHFHEWETAITGNPKPPIHLKSSDECFNPLPLIEDINSTTQQAIWDIQEELSQARQEIGALNQKVVNLENEKRGLNEHLENILSSRTWRMAKSIQSIAGVLKSKKESIDK